MKLLPEHVMGARGILRITQQELATAAGVGRGSIERFERGDGPPLKESTVMAILAALEERGIEFYNSGDPGVRYISAKAKIPRRT